MALTIFSGLRSSRASVGLLFLPMTLVFSIFLVISLNDFLLFYKISNNFITLSVIFLALILNILVTVRVLMGNFNKNIKIFSLIVCGFIILNAGTIPKIYFSSKIFLFSKYYARCVAEGVNFLDKYRIAICDVHERTERGLPVLDAIIFDSSDEINKIEKSSEWKAAAIDVSAFFPFEEIGVPFKTDKYSVINIRGHYYRVSFKSEVTDFVN